VAAGLRERLAGGGAAIATFLQTPHPVMCEFVASLGFDAVCIEAEHGAIDRAGVQSLVAATELGGAEPLVRVPQNEPVAIATALDAGARGVIVPRVGSAAAARAALAAARYPPLGERGFGPGRAAAYGADAGYVERANRELVVGVQVETRSAVERIDEIVAVDDLDLVFVGPNDLALSLGLPGGPDDVELARVIADVLDRARAAGRATGIFAASAADARRWLDHGAQLLVLGSDLLFVSLGARALRAELEEGRA
jgi:4-hydroxy-2-oxoheptanedioate aldolase